jgi:hypothetical protein
VTVTNFSSAFGFVDSTKFGTNISDTFTHTSKNPHKLLITRKMPVKLYDITLHTAEGQPDMTL